MLLFSSIVSAHVICIGSKCYQSEDTLRIEELLIDARLNVDESVDFTETLGLTYNSSSVEPNSNSMEFVLPDFFLPKGSEVYPEIKVTDIIKGQELTRVYFFDENCSSTFIYDEEANSVKLCIQPEDQMRIKIEAIILPQHEMQSYNQYAEASNNLSNPLTLVLPPNEYAYFTSMKIEGGDGVLISDIEGIVCKDENAASAGAADLKLISLNNGILCQGDLQPSNGQEVVIVLAVQGIDEQKILQKQQEALNNLQRENINASIRSSEATVSLSNATSMTVWLTIVIALFTGATVYTTMVTLRETRKRNKPVIKVKLDPAGTDKVVLKVVNIGKSSAVDVSIDYSVSPGGEAHKWHHHLVQEDDAIRMIPRDFKNVPLSKFLSAYDKLLIKSSWEDPHGNRYGEDYAIKLKEYQRSLDHNLSV